LRLGKGELIGYDGYRRKKGAKIHVAVSGESLPLSLVVEPGDEHDSKRFVEVLEGVRVKHGVGRPKTRPKGVYADSAYDTKEVRSYLRRRGIKDNIPVNPRNRLRPRRGRPYGLDEEAYKRMRRCVERFSARLTGSWP